MHLLLGSVVNAVFSIVSELLMIVKRMVAMNLEQHDLWEDSIQLKAEGKSRKSTALIKVTKIYLTNPDMDPNYCPTCPKEVQ